MILRAAIVFLFVLNLGVAAWWLSSAGLRAATSAPVVDSSQPGLRLVNEPVAPPVHASSPAPAAMPAAISTTAAEKPAAPPVPVAATALCLSFGPFADAAARDAARPKLQLLAQKLVARDSQARSTRGWRVYMPALVTREAAQALVDKIKAAGINDWYIIANGSEANSIALGRYGSQESARRRQAQLTSKGFTARAEPLGDTPPQWWLDARFAPDASHATLAAIASSKPLDCARLP
ncbi:SPOR domain-containing protein [Thermomonas sp.]|uniref:SPOR domain-containing protein n=1 Tax=Thermomonas sp. TaxID=1971895 RepID=UPI0024877E9C|nr:SPOR domain-containing protein [Thermomonas sp.]MDI1254118.1 SPOR domain-containing protein [Thermomonas sp.]